MQITRNNLETSPGPGDWFIGSVFVDIEAIRPGARCSSVDDAVRAYFDWGFNVAVIDLRSFGLTELLVPVSQGAPVTHCAAAPGACVVVVWPV